MVPELVVEMNHFSFTIPVPKKEIELENYSFLNATPTTEKSQMIAK